MHCHYPPLPSAVRMRELSGKEALLEITLKKKRAKAGQLHACVQRRETGQARAFTAHAHGCSRIILHSLCISGASLVPAPSQNNIPHLGRFFIRTCYA